jgi:hypothetical protein
MMPLSKEEYALDIEYLRTWFRKSKRAGDANGMMDARLGHKALGNIRAAEFIVARHQARYRVFKDLLHDWYARWEVAKHSSPEKRCTPENVPGPSVPNVDDIALDDDADLIIDDGVREAAHLAMTLHKEAARRLLEQEHDAK